jgi:glyoxylase-like metal-dependent hydrolase (beta-lactamase superfamily II)/rhodanese-related sulfurtransferase
MKVEQIYTGCLAQGAYYIQSEGEVAIIDPLREVGPYIEKAERDNVSIKYVLETHFHADFVSGHLDLAARTGATIVFGPTAQPTFKAHIAYDGETFKVGRATISVLHTPGHTRESVTYLLKDETGKEVSIFSGDTLLLGDVGRPDLAQKPGEITKEQLAGMLYDSIQSKIIPLPDDIIIYPGHGAGSACGKKMMSETTDTLGHQKKVNYALRSNISRDEFIKEVLEGQKNPPAYFPENARLNKEGYTPLSKVVQKGMHELPPVEFEFVATEAGAIVLDTRDAETFAKGFIPNSINIGIDGSFALWVGMLMPGVKQPIVIVADPGREEEVIMRLARIGYDNVLGFLQGGFDSWRKDHRDIDQIPCISAAEFIRNSKYAPQEVIDVRASEEYDAEHLVEAVNIPLDLLNYRLAEINKDKPVYIYCAAGYRSMIACSILKARGWYNVVNMNGGFKALASSIQNTNTSLSTVK